MQKCKINCILCYISLNEKVILSDFFLKDGKTEKDKALLDQIKILGQSVLDVIKDKTLKDLLSKLLVKEPEKRISWKEYFAHDFFK